MNLGECIVHDRWSSSLGVEEGDLVYMRIQAPNLMNALVSRYNGLTGGNLRQIVSRDFMDVPCKAKFLTSTANGKFPEDNAGNNNLMEYSEFLPLISDYLPNFLSNNEGFKAFLRENPEMIFDYADILVMTLPSPRTRYYESTNYDDTQRRITSYANKVTDALGYYPVVIKLGILDEMKTYSQAVLFLGLIFDIIILLFVIIAILLIYSLLMISVETKTLEMGIIRMVGLSKLGITVMVLIQGLMFVIPAIILGFALSSPALKIIYSYLFSDDLGVEEEIAPDGLATLQALVIGLLIPILSSIIPIRSVLSKNLNDALDYQRSKTQAVYVEVLDKDN